MEITFYIILAVAGIIVLWIIINVIRGNVQRTYYTSGYYEDSYRGGFYIKLIILGILLGIGMLVYNKMPKNDKIESTPKNEVSVEK